VHDVVGALGEAADRAEILGEDGDAGWGRIVDFAIAGAGLGILEIDVGGGPAGAGKPVDGVGGEVAFAVYMVDAGTLEAEPELGIPGELADRGVDKAKGQRAGAW
jgi:hypothetical protein